MASFFCCTQLGVHVASVVAKFTCSGVRFLLASCVPAFASHVFWSLLHEFWSLLHTCSRVFVDSTCQQTLHGRLWIEILVQGFLALLKEFRGSGVPAMPSLCVGVSLPGYRPRGWVAQSRQPRFWKGGFETEKEAASWLAGRLGVTRRSLLRAKAPPKVVGKAIVLSKFSGVVARHRPSGILWEARAPGGQVLGTYSSEQDAAKAVAGVRGVPVKRLLRPVPFTRRAATRVFKASYAAFSGYVPGDLQHLVQQEITGRSAFEKDTHAGKLVHVVCLVMCLLVSACLFVHAVSAYVLTSTSHR